MTKATPYTGGRKKHHRYRPGTEALREISRYGRLLVTTDLSKGHGSGTDSDGASSLLQCTASLCGQPWLPAAFGEPFLRSTYGRSVWYGPYYLKRWITKKMYISTSATFLHENKPIRTAKFFTMNETGLFRTFCYMSQIEESQGYTDFKLIGSSILLFLTNNLFLQ